MYVHNIKMSYIINNFMNSVVQYILQLQLPLVFKFSPGVYFEYHVVYILEQY